MSGDPTKIQPAYYSIRISGALSQERAEWLGDLEITLERLPGDGVITVLKGELRDQAALFGVLSRIRDLGLRLLSVNPVDAPLD